MSVLGILLKDPARLAKLARWLASVVTLLRPSFTAVRENQNPEALFNSDGIERDIGNPALLASWYGKLGAGLYLPAI